MPLWLDFQVLGQANDSEQGIFVPSLSASGTTAQQLSFQSYKVDPQQQVTIKYTSSINQNQIDNAGDVYRHNIMVDYAATEPGVHFITTSINLTI
jgi:hypothetical protein